MRLREILIEETLVGRMLDRPATYEGHITYVVDDKNATIRLPLNNQQCQDLIDLAQNQLREHRLDCADTLLASTKQI